MFDNFITFKGRSFIFDKTRIKNEVLVTSSAFVKILEILGVKSNFVKSWGPIMILEKLRLKGNFAKVMGQKVILKRFGVDL